MANNFYRELIPVDLPTTIRVTPILPADQMPDELAVFETVAAILQTEAMAIARNLTNGQIVTRNSLQRTARGYLQMTNINNNQHAHMADLLVSDLDVFTLMDLFDRVHAESNPDLTVYSVRWEFWVNPQSVVVGAARLGTTKNGTCDLSNKVYEFDNIRAGCAAICAMIFLIKKEPTHAALLKNIRRATSHRKIYDLAITLQDQLGISNL
jgi:hypothetical protein